jgi:ribosomal-protein-alanine N-acetyltransferase
MPALETERLRLVPISLAMVEGVMRRDRAAAEAALDVALREHGWDLPACARFPDAWPNEELVSRAFPFSIEAIRADPATRLWGDSLVLPREGPPRVVGSVVFKGRPPDGIAEVGYGIEEGSRGQGLATEATRACVEWALQQPGIEAVRATTFPWHFASLGVIRKLGMREVATREHDVLGELLVFELRRDRSREMPTR